MAKKFRVTYNSKQAAIALNGGGNARKAAVIMRQEYAKVVSESHRKALNSFKRHAVTREIKAGPYSNNKSGSLAIGNSIVSLALMLATIQLNQFKHFLKKFLNIV
jgi:hypothetical protein